ncbi:hypothetical protein D5086_030953 [Populus alba]|uniref:Uncharacterized protein n=1 Tax=Populus alba TaxID=43335 RepID=A0ACC4APX9_POPAL
MRRDQENEARGSERGTDNVSYQRKSEQIIRKGCPVLLLLSYERGWSFVSGEREEKEMTHAQSRYGL